MIYSKEYYKNETEKQRKEQLKLIYDEFTQDWAARLRPDAEIGDTIMIPGLNVIENSFSYIHVVLKEKKQIPIKEQRPPCLHAKLIKKNETYPHTSAPLPPS